MSITKKKKQSTNLMHCWNSCHIDNLTNAKFGYSIYEFLALGGWGREIGTSDLILDLDCLSKTLRMSEVNWKDQHTVDIS